ncbi:FtsX-like permease family protein [Clostridium swellfunianum]|uniref:ABC transporter permease n=1 Tax=Clostridium swellfunianum TaxID=1367462 RepID=UPI00202FD15E|nr:FtsX-like permease family protein [Clostridium swellfunianum]MCM0648875.1 FtsX-like permease family protein [Clostridium swellfunianum]
MMRSFWGIIPRYIIKNKKRIAFMGIGILLSVALIVSLSIIQESVTKTAYERMLEDSGGLYDISFFTRDYKTFKELEKDPLVEKISIAASIGTHKIPDSKVTVDIKAYDENITELLNFKLIDGRYPSKGNEIALEQWVLDGFSEKYKIGDTIKLSHSIEYRTLDGKQLPEEAESDFVLVGTFQHTANQLGSKNTAKAYITKEFLQDNLKNQNLEYSGYIMVKPKISVADASIQLALTSSYSKIFFSENITKTSTLQSLKSLSLIFKVLFIVIGVVASIIIFNVFNISISERTKEFGMLRAIGASPLRIKAIVLGEGITLGVIFIPLGIVLGSLAVKAVIMISSGYGDLSGFLDIPRGGAAAALAVGFLSIIMGVYFPAVKASRISPMEAISSNNNLNLKGRKIKSSLEGKGKLRKSFKFPANMAYLNINRNKKKFITTVISLSITIIMLSCANYLIGSADPIASFKKSFPGDFVLLSSGSSKDYGLTEKDIDKLSSIKGVEKISTERRLFSSVDVPGESITSKGMKYVEANSSKNPYLKELFDQKQYFFETTTLGYNAEELEKLKSGLIEGNIDVKKMKEKQLVIVAQNLNYKEYTNLKVGDKITINYPVYDEKGNSVRDSKEVFEVGAVVKEDAVKQLDATTSVMFIVSEEAIKNYLKLENYQQAAITLSKTANNEQVEKEIRDTMKLSRDLTIKSFKEELKAVKENNMKQSMILYSFIFIIAVVSIVNLVNIMYMNVMLRNKEIGMMRALGFGSDEVKTMIKYEGIFYGIAASLSGLILGVLLTYVIYIKGRGSFQTGMTWSFPALEAAIIFIATILITLIASILPSRKLFTSSIIEAIRGVE